MQNEAVAKRLLAARQAYIRNDEAAKQAEAEAQAAEDTANNSLEKPTTVSKVQHIGGVSILHNNPHRQSRHSSSQSVLPDLKYGNYQVNLT